MVRFFCLLALAATAAAPPVAVEVRPGVEAFEAVVSGEAAGSAAGRFSGNLVLNRASASLPVSGQAERTGGRVKVTFSVRYADVPAEWADRFRLADFDFLLRGTVAGKDRIEWSGAMRWSDVAVEGQKETAEKFVRMGSLRLTSLSVFASEASAEVTVRNPFRFPLKVASARYDVFANGHAVGSGQTQALLLHPSRENTLELPVEMEHGALIAAAGTAVASGGEVDGRLQGELQLRLPAGDVAVPLDLSGRFSLASQ